MSEEDEQILLLVKEHLENEIGCKFIIQKFEGYQRLVRIRKEYNHLNPIVPIMLSQTDLWDHFLMEERKDINWEVDWKDTEPICIDSIEIYNDRLQILNWREFPLDFIVRYYYNCYMACISMILRTRESRMKASRFIPAAIKDVEVFLRIANEILEKHEINKMEFIWRDISFLCHIALFSYLLRFERQQIMKDELVDNILRRARALTELRRRFREWLPSLERKKIYESTDIGVKVLVNSGVYRKYFKHLCAWPIEIEDNEMRRQYEEILKKEIKGQRAYNLNGYRVKLVGKRITVDKRDRLIQFPLGKIEFLKEDFPEMFM